jgi:hypothetical protein
MSRGRTLLVTSFILSLASVFSMAGSAKRAVVSDPGGTQQQKTTVFAVFGASGAGVSATMEPILIIDRGKYTQPVEGASDADAITSFSNEHYRKGQKYRLLFGGAEAGTVIVKKSDRDQECFRTGADITLQTSAKLNRNVMALATDSNSLGAAASYRSRRIPTQSERAHALELARVAFRQKGVAASLLPTIQVINLTAIELDRDGKAELAGSFVASKRAGKQERHTLFLLAATQGTSYRTVVSNYGKYTEKEIMSGASLNAVNEGVYVERLVDHLDLDGDSVSELVTTTTGLEGVAYQIYKRQGGEWRSAYEFNSYRCAF